jgi:hypothetical protein
MSIRHTARAIAAAAAALAAIGAFSAITLSSPAGATPPESGVTIPQSPYTAGKPYQSGQQIDVSVPAGTFAADATLQIEECTDPGGAATPPSNPATACDGNTNSENIATWSAESNGGADFNNDTGDLYTIYATPDTGIGDSGSSPVCNEAKGVQCILYIGENVLSPSAPYVWSAPFQIVSDAGDTAPSPGDGTPEVPYAVLLPLAAMALISGSVVIRRRRAAAAA